MIIVIQAEKGQQSIFTVMLLFWLECCRCICLIDLWSDCVIFSWADVWHSLVFIRFPWPACGWSDVSDSVVMDGGDGVRFGLEVLHTH